MQYDASLYSAVGDRLRPIFMSAGTSVLGMLPLAVIPGKGAELYQGLGIALTGGLALSTFLTPTVIPALMGLLQDFGTGKPWNSMAKSDKHLISTTPEQVPTSFIGKDRSKNK